MVKQTPSTARLSPERQSEKKPGVRIVQIASCPVFRMSLTSPVPSTIPVNIVASLNFKMKIENF
jgi:hypothetical protein